MNRVRLAVLVVVSAAAVAGCNAFVGGGGPATADGASYTPAPVPTTAVALPPGVTDQGVTTSRLVDAHSRSLLAANYTVRVTRRVTDDNGSVSTLTRRRTVAVGGEPYAGGYNQSVGRPDIRRQAQTVAYWGNGSGYATRVRFGPGRTFYDWSANGVPVFSVDGSLQLTTVLEALSLTVAERTETGVVLVGTGLVNHDALLTPRYVADPHNVSATIRVRRDGVVTAWRVAYDARTQGRDRDVRVVREFRVTDLGATTVERPAWVETATNRSGP